MKEKIKALSENSKKQSTKKQKPRMCVGCMEDAPKRTLLRIVRTPDKEVLYDTTGRTNGRGVYVCSQISCIELAKKKNAFFRALKVPIDEQIYEVLKEVCSKEQE